VSYEGFKAHSACCTHGKGVPILEGPTMEGLPSCGGVTGRYLKGVSVYIASKLHVSGGSSLPDVSMLTIPLWILYGCVIC
jgi:hypothetical protein